MAKKTSPPQAIKEIPQGADVLSLKYVALSTISKWDRNFKKHDMGAVIASIKQYGFKDPIKYEPTLNNGKGGAVEGNGRTEALMEWKKLYDAEEEGYTDLPRGIIEQDGEWFVPMLFGVDAQSVAAAEAYALDHNNLTMMGGDFNVDDIMKMWDFDVNTVIGDLFEGSQSVISVSNDLMESIAKKAGAAGAAVGFDSSYSIVVECKSEADQKKMLKRFEKDGLNVRALIS